MERETPSGHPHRPSRLAVAVRVGASVLALGFLVAVIVQQWDQLRERDLHFELVWLLAAVPVLLAFYALAAEIWQLLMRSIGAELPRRRAQSIWAQSLLARYVPGGVLMVLGRVVLAAREGVPARVTVASLAYEVSLLLASATAVGGYTLLFETDLNPWLKGGLLALIPLLVLALDPRCFGPLSTWALRLAGRDPLPTLIPLRRVLVLLGLYTLLWLVGGLGMFFAGLSIYPLELAELPRVIAAFAVGFSVAALLVVFPGGLGVRDAAYASVIGGSVGGFAVGATIAIAGRLVSTFVEVAYAGAVIWLGRRARDEPGTRP